MKQHRFGIKLHESILIFRLIHRVEPFYLACALPQAVLTAVQKVLAVYFPKLFIEQLRAGESHSDIVRTILLYAVIFFSVSTVNLLLNNKTEFLADRFVKKIRETTGTITMNLSVEVMEGADFHDRLCMANNVNEVIGVVRVLRNIISEVFTVAGLAVVIARLGAAFALLIGAVLTVKVFFVYLMQKRVAQRRVSYARNDRTGNYLNQVAYSDKGAAKEIRLNGLESWFMGKIRAWRGEMLELQYEDFRRYALFETAMSVVMAAQTFCVLWILSARYIVGTITIADFTMFFSAVTVISTSLSNVIDKLGEYNRMSLYMSDFDGLSEMGEETSDGNGTVSDFCEKLSFKKPAIRFEHVYFSYPGSAAYCLEDVNIEIESGEKLAVVGASGAGKSTFVKLLCRFYRPTEGRITVGGVDIWEISGEAYAKVISAVFQDYVNFSFTLEENVTMCGSAPEDKTWFALTQAGLSERVRSLPKGLHTFLSKKFDRQGIELSGGEGQKLAIARALYKNTPIVILDEPTASLDPKAENEIYETFFRAAENRTSVFISHRLAASTKADRIAVFMEGRIKECGTHGQLMEKGGLYADMFRKQGQAYSNV